VVAKENDVTTPQDHYERVLAQHYTWMFGVPFEEKVAEQAALLREVGVTEPGVAVDLGCGSGFQSVALADLGARRVHAVDASTALLRELEGHAGCRPIKIHEADLMAFDRIVGEPVDTIVCMGDTLTHLNSKEDVAALFGKVAAALPEGGRLVLSWRDLSAPPEGLDRFIPLRGTDERVMTCFLEDRGETVLIHDLVHVRGEAGWRLQKSAYPKLKLSPAWVRSALAAAGLEPVHEQTVRGMTVLAATR
jgi:predicted TPR repeat methyltransferase